MLCAARKSLGKEPGLQQHKEQLSGKLCAIRALQKEAREEGFLDCKDHTPREDTFFYRLQEIKAKSGSGDSVEIVQLTDEQICYQSNLIICRSTPPPLPPRYLCLCVR